ncbi:Glutaredoxin-1 [Serendipita sp. 399]|nr:Glutaredoxin-1 [Serendipita sp. 399]
MSAKAQGLVENSIKDDFITIFSKSYCPYCRRAKNIIKSLDLPDGKNVQIYELDLRDDGPAIQRYLLQKTGQSTVPNIFINQRHIGGSDELAALNNKGELKKLIQAKRTQTAADDN